MPSLEGVHAAVVVALLAAESNDDIHCFLEFARPVDWQSCTALRFKGIQPNLSPCRARGARWRDAADQGHFYVWAAKVHLRWVTL